MCDPDDRHPLAYFLTFTCYGARLHGDDRGSVDRRHNAYGAPAIDPEPGWVSSARARMSGGPVGFAPLARELVEEAIRGVCAYRGWELLAVNACSNHVHVVVSAAMPPATIVATFKAWASRRLGEARLVRPGSRVWARHGSTRYLWAGKDVDAACTYVTFGQD